jgi:hypothetical protein
MGGGRVRGALLGLRLLLAAALGGCGGQSTGAPPAVDGGAPTGSGSGAASDGGVSRTAAGGGAVILAAGDIACAKCAHRETAALLAELSRGGRAAAILPLGDQAYDSGTLAEFEATYATSWGVPELRALSHPVPGNHEYDLTDAEGYFDYFNGVGVATGMAGTRGQGYYSFDVGTWHVVALNSSDGCNAVRCDAGSPQQAWLAADLAAHPARCTLAYWHVPRFQGGSVAGDDDNVAALWDTFYDAGGDVVLNAHEHNYQQLEPLDKAGGADRARGIRSFVVGTGGAGLYDELGAPHEWALETSATNTHGVLELTLLDGSYHWRFVGVDGIVPYGASGSASCH